MYVAIFNNKNIYIANKKNEKHNNLPDDNVRPEVSSV